MLTFYESGDWLEAFGDDAVTAARILELPVRRAPIGPFAGEINVGVGPFDKFRAMEALGKAGYPVSVLPLPSARNPRNPVDWRKIPKHHWSRQRPTIPVYLTRRDDGWWFRHTYDFDWRKDPWLWGPFVTRAEAAAWLEERNWGTEGIDYNSIWKVVREPRG